MAGPLGVKRSRKFKIYREAFPAIFRFDGQLYQELYDIDANETKWVEISVEHAERWLNAQKGVSIVQVSKEEGS